jgi:hypothetical protein
LERVAGMCGQWRFAAQMVLGRVEGASGGAELSGDDDAVPVEIDARSAQRVKLARGQRRPKHSAAAATPTKKLGSRFKSSA